MQEDFQRFYEEKITPVGTDYGSHKSRVRDKTIITLDPSLKYE